MTISYEKYNITDHRHREACWAAGRSAQRGGRGMTVEMAFYLIEKAGLEDYLHNPKLLPKHPEAMDAKHREWRSKIIREAKKKNVELKHGRAAKLINSYFKAALVCGGHHKIPQVALLHPPIDRLLLEAIAPEFKNNNFKRIKTPWTQFKSSEYEKVIDQIRRIQPPNAPLWKIERYWKGYS